jgi:DNA polymerase I-like protein with 3'-5' exonuclease and polymerase domains
MTGTKQRASLFWDTACHKPSKRLMPPIPETGWRPPQYLPNLSAARYLQIDVETWDPYLIEHGPGWARGKGHIVGMSVGTDDGYSWYFPIRHEVEPQDNLDPSHVLAWARDTLSNPYQPKIGANLMYDVGWLRQEGVFVRGELVDVQFAEALLDEHADVNLEALSQRYLGEGKVSSLLYQWCAQYYGGEANGSQRANIYRTPPRLAGPYAESDARLPAQVLWRQYQRLISEGLLDLLRMECALIPLLIDMRFAGVSVDTARAEQTRDLLLCKSAEESEKLRQIVGFDVEVGSADSVARAFDRIGAAYNRTAKGKPTFTKEFLEGCHNPVADRVVAIRQLEKLRTTFIESYILESNVNGKLYCQFHPLRGDAYGTRGGRFSSSNPDLQNIPSRDPYWGPIIRSLFVPDAGHKCWRKYDYSQIEYRFLVHYAVGPGSDEVRALFNSNPDTDYHDMTLSLVAPYAHWDVSTKELRKQWRKLLKNINFGFVFGMGEGTLADTLHLPKAESKALLATYHQGAPFVRPTLAACAEEAQLLGFITTILGRRSRFDKWEPRHRNYDEEVTPLPYEQALRLWGPQIMRAYTYIAVNNRLQGSAAELLKTAMYLCHTGGVFQATGVPRLTVHDELDFSDPGGCGEAFREMQHIMETAIMLRIPVRAGLDMGPDWGHVEEVQEERLAWS